MDDVEDDSKEFDDGFDENLMGDEDDRRKLAQMTEKEREQELFNRSERRETLRIRFEIERKLRSKAKKREQEKKQGKQVRARKRLRASEIYSSDGSSDESEEYVPDTDKATLNELATGGKSSKMNTRASSSALLSSSSSESVSSSSSPSSASSTSDSEPEQDDLGDDDDSQAIQDDFQISLVELRCLQLKRDTIEKWVYSPFFKETVIGLFVKISIGNIRSTGEPYYKIGQIVDIIKGMTVYPLSADRNKTDKQCQVRIGGVERTYKMSFVSNRPFDEEDYNKWRETLIAENQNMPTRDHFERKKRDLVRASNYEYRDEDIAYEVNERNRFKDMPSNFALMKAKLMGEKADAESSMDFERALEIQRRLDDLEEKVRELEKNRNSTRFSAISTVNERNRTQNISESEKALKESKTVKTEDPFTRRKCTPKIVHNKNNNNNGDSANGSNDKNGQNQAGDSKTNQSKAETGAQTANNSVKSVDDLFQVHADIDLQLDIEI